LLLVGDDWAEDHHDVELMAADGRVLTRALPEGAAGMARLHAMVGEQAGQDGDAREVRVGIETDWGLWVMALAAAGYAVFGINPLQAARYRERHSVSRAKSDAGDAHVLADMVRADAHQLRLVAADSPGAQAVKVVACAVCDPLCGSIPIITAISALPNSPGDRTGRSGHALYRTRAGRSPLFRATPRRGPTGAGTSI
jgi:Transposase